MRIIDLSYPISPDMPAYPGTKPPVFTTGCSIDDIGFLESKITLYSHTGTHIDAPAHIIKGSRTLDQLPIEHFHGIAFLLDLTRIENQVIDIDELESHQDAIEQIEFLLLNTGWSRYWGTDKYLSDYPVLSSKAAEWLSRFDLKGLGLDTISADEADSQDFPIHRVFLQNNTVIIENLTNLDILSTNQFVFSCLPLKFENADGSPARAVAFIT